MKLQYKLKIPEYSDQFNSQITDVVAKCLCLAGFEINSEIYKQLTKEERSLFEVQTDN